MNTWCLELLVLRVPSLTFLVFRLGSTLARVKLKGIDGGPHKRWSMWFNSTQREEPYPGSKCRGTTVKAVFRKDSCIGAAWLSSARVVRCWVKSRNERNPCLLLPSGQAGHSVETAGDKPEEGEDDVKSAWPLCLGLHTCYNGRYRRQRSREVKHACASLRRGQRAFSVPSVQVRPSQGLLLLVCRFLFPSVVHVAEDKKRCFLR